MQLRNYDSWLTAPLRKKHDMEDYIDRWFEQCEKQLRILEYSEEEIQDLEDTIIEVISKFRDRQIQDEPDQELEFMHHSGELEARMLKSKGL